MRPAATAGAKPGATAPSSITFGVTVPSLDDQAEGAVRLADERDPRLDDVEPARAVEPVEDGVGVQSATVATVAAMATAGRRGYRVDGGDRERQ